LLQEALRLISQGPPVHSYCVSAYDRLAETAIAMVVEEPPGARRRACVTAAGRACSTLERASRVFAIAKPAAALHRGALRLALGPGRRGAVLQSWHDAIAGARALTLPLQELRLRAAILSGLPSDDRRREPHLRRARELVGALALGSSPNAPLLIDPPGLGAGVKIEGELELSR
jgi:hypothetical protein